jgi:hypothetical protein
MKHLDLVEERHYEKDVKGYYVSLQKKTPFNHRDSGERYGILSAKFSKK